MADDVVELHGDRAFGDDEALVGGFATIEGHRVVFIGHQKGADVDENIRRNFGMPRPEGYRKAARLMRLAERLGLPVVTFVDTPGADPGAPSEERGQAEAIARSIALMTGLRTPIVTVICGEGGSGGALAIAVGDVVLALENAIYSVISPEGCASILWRTPDRAREAAVAMRLTAREQQALGVIDTVIARARRGRAHRRARDRAAAPRGDRRRAREPRSHATSRSSSRPATLATVASAPSRRPSSPIRERRERRRVVDRLRALLDSGRPVLAVGSGAPLTPGIGDELDDEPAAPRRRRDASSGAAEAADAEAGPRPMRSSRTATPTRTRARSRSGRR